VRWVSPRLRRAATIATTTAGAPAARSPAAVALLRARVAAVVLLPARVVLPLVAVAVAVVVVVAQLALRARLVLQAQPVLRARQAQRVLQARLVLQAQPVQAPTRATDRSGRSDRPRFARA
jgi:hypothetical protein